MYFDGELALKFSFKYRIIIRKESDKKEFTIVKTLSASTLHSANSRIIGTFKKEGLLLKFTAFDKSIKNETVTV